MCLVSRAPALHAESQLYGPQVRMDRSDGRTDLRMSIPETSGCFVRTTAKRDGSLLLIGGRRRPSPRPLR